MKHGLPVLAAVALAVFSWGIYGPTIHHGQVLMDGSRLRPFICVGLAYFLIAVVVPIVWLRLRGEKGQWTASGIVWSLAAGAAGAVGALGVILAFTFRGNPIYVMPLVFGGAPVVNTVLTALMARTYRQIGPLFLTGLALVIGGAATVLIFKPSPAAGHSQQQYAFTESAAGITAARSSTQGDVPKTETIGPATLEQLKQEYPEVYRAYQAHQRGRPLLASELLLVALSVGVTALCWGSYGPVLHQGQMKMRGSRLRPFLCVGLAYFAIAVVAPLLLLPVFQEPGTWTASGTVWSLIGGAAGAAGALGVILAFNFGGRPVYVMPLIFGGAPVVNTLVQLAGTQPTLPFYVGLAMVIAGAVTVLVFAPRPAHGPAPATAAPQPAS